MNAQDIIEAALHYLSEHLTCECGQKGLIGCDDCAETRKSIALAYITGVSACAGILIAEDGNSALTPYAIYGACKSAIEKTENA